MSKSASSNHDTTDRVSESAHESVDRVAETAGKGEEKIRREAANADARARDAGQKVKERSDETLHSIGVFVRDNPLTSLGIAFAAGTLVSAFTRRS